MSYFAEGWFSPGWFGGAYWAHLAAGELSVRDAFRAELDSIITAAGIDWLRRDTLNTGENPDAGAGYLDLEFGEGDEEPDTFGSPGANVHIERAVVFVHAYAPAAWGSTTRDLAETHLEEIRQQFRARRFNAAGQQIRITGTAAMGGGEIEGGLWAETIALSYETRALG